MTRILTFVLLLVLTVTILNMFGHKFVGNVSVIELQRQSHINAEQNKRDLLNASRGSPSFEDLMHFYQSVKMEAYCENKVVIGKPANAGTDGSSYVDGAKYACNPSAVKREKCTLLSLGLNNQIDFDEQVFVETGKRCLILGADKDLQTPETQKKYENMGGQLFVGKVPNDLTIRSMLEKAGRTEVELAKIDIEGGEFTGLEPLIREFYVCQILIEVHGTPADHLRMLQIMSKYGFRLFNIDRNVLCPACCEYSLINKKCMDQFGVVPLASTIPMPSS